MLEDELKDLCRQHRLGSFQVNVREVSETQHEVNVVTTGGRLLGQATGKPFREYTPLLCPIFFSLADS